MRTLLYNIQSELHLFAILIEYIYHSIFLLINILQYQLKILIKNKILTKLVNIKMLKIELIELELYNHSH